MTATSSASTRVKETPRLTIHAHPGQARVLTSDCPVVAAIAGTGGGKTVCGMVWLANNMVRKPGHSWLVVEPTQEMITRVLLPDAPGRMSLVKLLKYYDPDLIYRKSESAIYTRYGTVFLASATNPLTLEGAHVAGAWLDEAGQMGRLAFETARRRTSFLNGQVLITTTPYNRGWLFQEVYQPWREGTPGIEVIQFSSLANPKYPKDVYERNRATMSAARFRMMHEGGFERPEGMIYETWSDEYIEEPFDVPCTWEKIGGLDFGWNNPFAAVWLAKDPDDVWHLYHEYKHPQRTIEQHHKQLTGYPGPQPNTWYADPAGSEERRMLRLLGMTTTPGNNEVLAGIDKVNEIVGTGRLRVFRSCRHWLDEIEGYVWDTSADVFIDKPRKVNDHLMDATRYALMTRETRTGLRMWT